MATANPSDGLRELRTLKLAHSAAVEVGEVIVSGGNVLVAVNAAEADELNIYVYRGKVSFPKGAGVIGAAVAVYWDTAGGEITTTDTANTRAGITAEAAADADTMVLVDLGPN